MGYKTIETKLNMSCFFRSCILFNERGLNENLNGLVRRFFPKKTDFAKVSDENICEDSARALLEKTGIIHN